MASFHNPSAELIQKRLDLLNDLDYQFNQWQDNNTNLRDHVETLDAGDIGILKDYLKDVTHKLEEYRITIITACAVCMQTRV